jgi:hypothetical protein
MQQFVEITGGTSARARQCLSVTSGDLGAAIERHFQFQSTAFEYEEALEEMKRMVGDSVGDDALRSYISGG